MGIEYMIDFPCRPKKEMGEEHLINLVKQAKANAPKKSVGTVETAQILEVPTEGAVDDASARLRKDLSQLDFYISDCLSCPANASADKSGAGPEAAFGCHLEIMFPIRGDMEKAVMSAGLDALQNPRDNPGSKLVMGILRSHQKGKKTPAHKVRKMGKDFFESRAAIGAKLNFQGQNVNLDTDQLMTLLMLGPVPAPATGAFSVFISRGVERAKMEGVQDPWVLAPLKMLSEHMKAASALGKAVKVKY
jgi:hypothetical protein